MASISSFIRTETDFDDEAIRIMEKAFDAACRSLRDSTQSDIVHEVIGRRIVEVARKGERDPIRLRIAGLVALGYEYDEETG
jgi:hypothetical protein